MNQTLSQEARARLTASYELWRNDPYFDEATRQELQDLGEEEVFDRFYTDLEFGTAGLRGVLGAGINRMNLYVVRKVTQALAEVIAEQGDAACARGVAIAYDSRHFSDRFAEETSRVLAQNGIRSYLFDALRPTPELSFAVRQLGCIAGVMVTASHNPKEHNGYKVYWEDGSQIVSAKADRILARMREREDWRMEVSEKEHGALRSIVGAELDALYLAEVARTLVQPELIREKGGELTIVYSPLHGAGNLLVRRALAEAGFSAVHVVAAQELPDGDFPTVAAPNPENPAALAMSLELARQVKADLALVSDPDADRLGMASPDAGGEYHCLSGNQIGVLLLSYLLERKRAQNALPKDAVVVKTIASTDLAEAVAAEAGVELRNVHVGFKFIGEQILSMEQSGKGSFLFGFEESLGYLAGTYARDKDAVGAALLLSEAALYYKTVHGQTLWEVLQGIYARFGTYEDAQMSVNLEGAAGRQTIDAIMRRLREAPPRALAGRSVKTLEDYEACRAEHLADGTTTTIDLPPANVLRFSLEGGGYVMARPSGTEPKIKFYFSLKSGSAQEGRALLEAVKGDFLAPLRDLLDAR